MLAAWADSPTRFREDANAEEDLLLGGYADRWLVELAQNAADAAARAGVPGDLLVRVIDGELRVANTGAPLDADGVAALASLRASTKRDSGAVGRFGVGFAAVLGVSAEPRVVSRSGGVRFSAARTIALVNGLSGVAPAELARRDGRPPVLRLPWPVAGQQPPAGYDTEVALPLRPGSDPAGLTGSADAAAADLLLALPGLTVLTVEHPDRRRVEHRRTDAPDGTVVLDPGGRRWRLARRSGTLTEAPRAAEDRADWTVCWALPLHADGRPAPLAEDVLHAPTPSDERLGLPARLIAGVPMQPSRRRVRPGAALEEVLRAAAASYLDLVLATPAADRVALAPAPGFPLGEVDGALRAAVSSVLETARWLPAAGVEVGSAAEQRELAPAAARLLDPPGAGGLPALVADAVPELAADVAPGHRAALTALGARPLRLAELADRLAAPRWPPTRWRAVYAALATVADGVPEAREELAALPVPLADGRTVTGPRTVLLLEGEPDRVAEVTAALRELDLPGVRVADPAAAHPLLATLGATSAGPAEVLDHPAVVEAVRRSVDEPALDALSALVLGLIAELDPDKGLIAGARPWLGALALPDVHGELRRADELVLPDAAIRPLLARDSPFGVLAPELARRHPRAVLTAVGVLDTFAVLVDDRPAGPDHELADEEEWWDGLDRPPERLVAVRDLDLVDDDAWPAALAVLAADPAARRALLVGASGPGVRGRGSTGAAASYTGWWLARHARLAGRRPGAWRLPTVAGLAGLYDPVPADAGGTLREDVLAAIGVRHDLHVRDRADAAELLTRLGDPTRSPSAALTQLGHAALAEAVLIGRVDPADLDPPPRLRASAGTVVDAERAVLLDQAWLAPVLDPAETVPGVLGDPERLDALAELLDLPTASEVVSGFVVAGAGAELEWSTLPEVVAACAVLGVTVPTGAVLLHPELVVRTTRPAPARHRVPAWRDNQGRWHAEDAIRALLGVLAERRAASSDE